eukprot:498935_1
MLQTPSNLEEPLIPIDQSNQPNINDKNVYTLPDTEDRHLYQMVNRTDIHDMSREEFCDGYLHVVSSLDCVSKYQFKKLRMIPQPVTSAHALNKAQQFIRVDNVVYIYDGNYYWHVKVCPFSAHCCCKKTKTSPHQNQTFLIRLNYAYDMSSGEHNNICVRTLIKTVSFLLSYSMIWSVISDILLITNIYYEHDTRFFIASLVFFSIPLLIVSLGIVWLSNEDGLPWYFYIPILNIPAYVTSSIRQCQQTSFGIGLFLSGLMIYPLYIINLSFMLESYETYNEIPIYNILQCTFSLFTLCVSPFMNILKAIVSTYLNKGLVLSIKDKMKIYSIVSLSLMPTLLIEIIHFFPILFAYYIDGVIDYQQVLWIMILFNVPKFVFVIHMIKKANMLNEGVCLAICTTVCISVVFITLPLVPYFFMMFGKGTINIRELKESSNKTIFFSGCWSSTSKYYWNVVFYLVISYGVSSAYLIGFVGANNMSLPLSIALFAVIVLMIFITLSVPALFYYFKRYTRLH